MAAEFLADQAVGRPEAGIDDRPYWGADGDDRGAPAHGLGKHVDIAGQLHFVGEADEIRVPSPLGLHEGMIVGQVVVLRERQFAVVEVFRTQCPRCRRLRGRVFRSAPEYRDYRRGG